MFPFAQLPPEVQLQALRHVDFASLLSVRGAARVYRRLVDANPSRLAANQCHNVSVVVAGEVLTIEWRRESSRGPTKSAVIQSTTVWRHFKCMVLEIRFTSESGASSSAATIDRLRHILNSSPKHCLSPKLLSIRGCSEDTQLCRIPELAGLFAKTVSQLAVTQSSLPTDANPYLTESVNRLPLLNALSLGFSQSSWWLTPPTEHVTPHVVAALRHITNTRSVSSLNLSGMIMSATQAYAVVKLWQTARVGARFSTFYFASGPTNEAERQRFVQLLSTQDQTLAGACEDKTTATQNAGRIFFRLERRVLFLYWTDAL